jgi:hypothetical protein
VRLNEYSERLLGSSYTFPLTTFCSISPARALSIDVGPFDHVSPVSLELPTKSPGVRIHLIFDIIHKMRRPRCWARASVRRAMSTPMPVLQELARLTDVKFRHPTANSSTRSRQFQRVPVTGSVRGAVSPHLRGVGWHLSPTEFQATGSYYP